MSEDAPDTIEAESGTPIPVRMEGGYPTYTDQEGKQLATGHDISPGTEQQWDLGNEVEHDPAKAHEMHYEAKHVRLGAIAQDKAAKRARIAAARGDTTNDKAEELLAVAERHERTAGHLHAVADQEMEEAGRRYDAERQGEDGEPDKTENPSTDGSGDEQWDIDKATTIGTAVDKTHYSENSYPGSIKGHPAEMLFRSKEEDALEALYELNPEGFAQMPTGEFIGLAREFYQINSSIRESEEKLAEAQKLRKEFVDKYGLSEDSTQETPA